MSIVVETLAYKRSQIEATLEGELKEIELRKRELKKAENNANVSRDLIQELDAAITRETQLHFQADCSDIQKIPF